MQKNIEKIAKTHKIDMKYIYNKNILLKNFFKMIFVTQYTDIT